jgi:uncharacterized protein
MFACMKQSPQFEIQTNLFSSDPLTDDEWDELDRLLKSLDSDDAMRLSVLEGYIAGILCCPTKLKPSTWFPLIWGDENAYNALSDEQVGRIVDLVLQHYNYVKSCLDGHETFYVPAFELDKADMPIWELWTEGFALAMEVGPNSWEKLVKKAPNSGTAAEVIVTMMSIIDVAISGGLVPEEEQDRLRALAPEAIPELTKALYELNTLGKIKVLDGRESFDGFENEMASDIPKVGRNDPCPCGSGKKYKKCHGG